MIWYHSPDSPHPLLFSTILTVNSKCMVLVGYMCHVTVCVQGDEVEVRVRSTEHTLEVWNALNIILCMNVFNLSSIL